MNFLKEFFEFLMERKKYWLFPIILVLALFGSLIILSQGSVIDPFIYTMSAVKSAFESITQKIENKTIFEHTPEIQDKSKEIKYSKKNEFNDEVIKKFFLNKIDLNSTIFKLDLYKNPYFLKNL